MAQAAVSTEAVDDPGTVRPATTDYDRSTALSKVAAFIPTEAVAVYLALVAFFNPDSDAMRWVLFAVGAVLVPVFYVLAYLNRRRQITADGGAPAGSLRVTLLLLFFALLAFVAWAAAMPNNPFVQFTDEATKFGGGAVIVLGVLLPQAATALGLTKQ